MSGEEMINVFGDWNDNNSPHQILIKQIVRDIMDAMKLDVGENSSTIFTMLQRILEKSLTGRNGALNNYYHERLRKILPEIYANFDLVPENIDIDINHGDESKLYSIIKEIKKKYNIDTPNRRVIVPTNFGKRNEKGPNSEQAINARG